MSATFLLDGQRLTLDRFVELVDAAPSIALGEAQHRAVERARAVVQEHEDRGAAVYGLTTRLGSGRDHRIDQEEMRTFQEEMVLYHAGDVGEVLSEREVRAIMLARLRGFAEGCSGISPSVVSDYLAFWNHGITPVVRRDGSVGASDLALLAAIARTLLGFGEVVHQGERLPADLALSRIGATPSRLGGKDGLALISANSYSIGAGILALREYLDVFELMLGSFSLQLEAVDANLSWLDTACDAARPFTGQHRVAEDLRRRLADSRLADPETAGSLQDPLSARSFSHLCGAALETAAGAGRALERELNGSGDNPLVDIASGRMISSANFSAFEIAFAFEGLRVAAAQLGNSIERRLQNLARFRYQRAEEGVGLPVTGTFTFAFAAISARLRALANPVTLSIPPLALGQEDSASGAPLAIDATAQSVRLLRELVLAELLLSTDLLRARELEPAPGLRHLPQQVEQILGASPISLGEALERLSGLRAPSRSMAELLDLDS